ncbi:MAG: phosphate ABC transporter permease [Gammaproteobacteria bacterium RIFCSPLOWO2_12_47_11]|nr:MAG: phosphate ABC transporter permease [Gammaproteobacteria bacterium RIFCSPLOWO2_12_47_11]
MSELTSRPSLLPDFNAPAAVSYRRWRGIKDRAARHLMALGGISVLIAIILIAFYLLYVVLPMFRPAHIEVLVQYDLPGNPEESTVYYAIEEQHEIGLRASESGDLYFFKTAEGTLIKSVNLFEAHQDDITAFSAGDPTQGLLAFATGKGTVLLVQHRYRVTYPNDVRLITPAVEYPLENKPVVMDVNKNPIRLIAAQAEDNQVSIAAAVADVIIRLSTFSKETSLISDETTVQRVDATITMENPVIKMVMDIEQRELYVADNRGNISYFDISNKTAPRLVQKVHAVPDGTVITSLEFLAGGISILVGDSRGTITQWFPVRDQENNYTLQNIRNFRSLKAPVVTMAPDYSRKGFTAIDKQGYIGIYHTTAHRTVKKQRISEEPLTFVAVDPRGNAMLVEDSSQQLQFWQVENEHPEISWRSIWGKVWYESRQQPEYIWQSSSASNDFEPKFSLTPLAFGTLKAALYAMLFSIPLAILGAIYTAYFMNARMRAYVKPTIEMMGALPTVILGFLAGLWLAPFIEKNLPGVLMLMLLLPVTMLISAYLWQFLPKRMRQYIPEGWEAAILIPIILLAGVAAIALGRPVENLFFAGNMPLWLTNVVGINFDQRNSLVVGIAMGFAVIPTIFSISEDAIYGVPKQLTTGSLALGATPWQTMMGVVLLTASPGIFSAIMIGFGRAVGETMIVVMATGNTAIMDMNIFQGFRALSANIAVEMPESEVSSTHYRILFLAGLVLFAATFLFNTIAEIVRQRLRTKYSNL